MRYEHIAQFRHKSARFQHISQQRSALPLGDPCSFYICLRRRSFLRFPFSGETSALPVPLPLCCGRGEVRVTWAPRGVLYPRAFRGAHYESANAAQVASSTLSISRFTCSFQKLSEEFEPAEALGSEVLPQLPLRVRRFRAQPSPALPRSLVVRTHRSRPQKAR